MSLQKSLETENIKLSSMFYSHVNDFTEHLMRWNKIHNLTGAKTVKEIENNIYDAVYALKFLPDIKNAIDIGTGAGFPGMILAFALPETHFTLVEPLQKRTSFLQFIVGSLKLSNVTIETKKIEDVKPTKIDLITSRAVTDTKLLMKLSHEFIQKDTLLLFYKGTSVKEEIDESQDYKIFERDNRRYLLIKSK